MPSKRYVALFLEVVATRRGGKTQQAAVYKAFSDHLDDAYKNFFLQKRHLEDACKKIFLQKRPLDDAYKNLYFQKRQLGDAYKNFFLQKRHSTQDISHLEVT